MPIEPFDQLYLAPHDEEARFPLKCRTCTSKFCVISSVFCSPQICTRNGKLVAWSISEHVHGAKVDLGATSSLSRDQR